MSFSCLTRNFFSSDFYFGIYKSYPNKQSDVDYVNLDGCHEVILLTELALRKYIPYTDLRV